MTASLPRLETDNTIVNRLLESRAMLPAFAICLNDGELDLTLQDVKDRVRS